MTDINERIIRKLKSRDEKAFDKVYDAYYKLVYFVALDILKDESSAEDILQETFIKLMDNIESYDETGSFKRYLVTIARNLALNEYKKRHAHEVKEFDENFAEAKNNDELSVILTLNDVLEPTEADIIKYKVLYDYSFQEIADLLKFTLGKVQSQYYIAIKKLKKHFKEMEEM